MTKKNHYRQVASQKTVWRAWQSVKENGKTSQSQEIQGEIRRFDQEAIKNIQSLVSRLSKKTFKFPPAKGIPKRKPGKETRRGIVLAPLESRIVQRSILEVIQEDPALKSLFDNPNSFGGLKKKGVKDAVLKAQRLIKNGNCNFYICSDISGFFDHVRPKAAVDEVRKLVNDDNFISLLENAQGCCLSPLVGNIYLKQFDKDLNSRDVFCLRYIDDFIILGPNEKAVRAKFKKARELLNALGLSVYDPQTNPDKASEGPTAKGFDYLGCFVSPDVIRPSAKSWKKLKTSTEETFRSTLDAMRDPQDAVNKGKTFSTTVRATNLRLEGWIKQYKFCTDTRVVGQWNQHLRALFLEFENHFFKLLSSSSNIERADLLGFYDIDSTFKELRALEASSETGG